MPVTLYHFAPSPPSRCALLTARALGLDIDVKVVNLLKKEQLDPEFVSKNPQHTVPTLDDNGFILWESRAIATYLASTYDKTGKLYPRDDLSVLAKIDSLLYFDAGTLFPNIRMIVFPVLFMGETKITQERRDKVNTSLELLNIFLEGKKWSAGLDHYNVADLSILASVSGLFTLGWDMKPYPNIEKWFERCSTIPGYEENVAGAKMLTDMVKSKLEPGEI